MSLFNFPYYREHGGPGRGPFAEPPFPVIRGLGDPRGLAQQPQHWFLAPGWRAPGTKPNQVPREIAPGKTTAFTLDLAPPATGWKRDGRLRIQADKLLGSSPWRAKLNGEELAATSDASEPYPNPYPALLGQRDELCAWRVPATLLRDGLNRAEVAFESGEPVTIVFLDLAAS
jgi:hypothetical protein